MARTLELKTTAKATHVAGKANTFKLNTKAPLKAPAKARKAKIEYTFEGSLVAAAIRYLAATDNFTDKDEESGQSMAAWVTEKKSLTFRQHLYAQRICKKTIHRVILDEAGFDIHAIAREQHVAPVKTAADFVKIKGTFLRQSLSGKAFQMSCGAKQIWVPYSQCRGQVNAGPNEPVTVDLAKWLATEKGVGA